MRPTRASETSATRRERPMFGVAKRKLSIDQNTERELKKAGMVPRWINDVHGRIQDAVAGGYEFVGIGGVRLGDGKEKTQEDRKISKRVGSNKDGSAITAYLMAIPEDYYQEDQAEKEKINMRVDDAIRGGTPIGVQPHGVNPSQGSTTIKHVEYRP